MVMKTDALLVAVCAEGKKTNYKFYCQAAVWKWGLLSEPALATSQAGKPVSEQYSEACL